MSGGGGVGRERCMNEEQREVAGMEVFCCQHCSRPEHKKDKLRLSFLFLILPVLNPRRDVLFFVGFLGLHWSE